MINANVTGRSAELIPPATLSRPFRADVKLTRDVEGNTPLHATEDPDFVRYLIERAPDLLCVKNSRGETPLMRALRRATSSFFEEKKHALGSLENSLRILQVFLDQGATLPPDENQALLKAFLKAFVQDCFSGKSIIEKLIDEGIDWNRQSQGELLLKNVIDAALVDSRVSLDFSAISSLLLGAGCSLKKDVLKSILIDGVSSIWVPCCCELVKLVEKREVGGIRAIDPEGEILQRLVEEVVHSRGCSNNSERLELISLLMDIGVKKDWLKNCLLAGLQWHKIHGCHELVKWMEERESGSVCAIDPKGEIAQRLVERVLDSDACENDPKNFDLIVLMMDTNLAIERDWWKSRFLAALQQGQIHGCCELVKQIEERKKGSIHAIDPAGKIFQDLIMRVMDFSGVYQMTECLALAEELLDLDFDSKADVLKENLLKGLAQEKRFACQELIRLFQKKRRDAWVASNLKQEIVNVALHRVFDNFPKGDPGWGLLLVDLGFEPSGDFLERFFAVILSSYFPVSKSKELCEHLIRAQAEPLTESDPEGTLVSMVIRAMCRREGLRVTLPPEIEMPSRAGQYQLYMGLLNSLIDAGAVIPDEIEGTPLLELLDRRPSLREARDAVAFASGRRTTKNARRRP